MNNISALVQIMACLHSGNKPLSEPVMVSFKHVCVTQRANEYLPILQVNIMAVHDLAT